MYQLVDTFNGRVISSHRTPEAAFRADDKYQRQVKAANGSNSYIPTVVAQGTRKAVNTALDAGWQLDVEDRY